MEAVLRREVTALGSNESAEPLQVAMDPFAAKTSNLSVGRPVRTALGELAHYIRAKHPLVIVAGAAGTGKSLLLDMTARACASTGLSIRREGRGDLIDGVPNRKKYDLLLIDEADVVPSSALQKLLADESGYRPTTMVFMCLPNSVSRFNQIGNYPPLVQLQPMSARDAHEYLLAGATSMGRPDLFAAGTLDLIIEQSSGSPRLLRQNASLAFFSAAFEGCEQICPQHVSRAFESRAVPSIKEDSGKSLWRDGAAIELSKSVTETGHTPPEKPSAEKTSAEPVFDQGLALTSRDDAAKAQKEAYELQKIYPQHASRAFESRAVPSIKEDTGKSVWRDGAAIELSKSVTETAHAPPEKPSAEKSSAEPVFDQGLALTSRDDAAKAQEEAYELQKMKRREANRIFSPWRVGK